MKTLTERYFEAMNQLSKWKMLFAGWQVGTRPKGDPECDAIRDHREVTILLRTEVTALSHLLIEKGVLTLEEYQQATIDEAKLLSKDYEARFPGVKATPIGLEFDIRTKETMKDWKP